MTLAWDANPESTVTGYFVYVGTTSGLYTQAYDVGNTTTYTFNGGTAGQVYYFAVAAYVSGPVLGPKSSEVSTTVAAAPGGGSSGGGGGGGGGGTVAPTTTTTRPPTITPPSTTAPSTAGPGVVLQPAIVAGTSLTLQWGAVGGLTVLEYVIEAGSSPGVSNIYNGSVGMANTVSATIGPGVYYVRIRARTGSTTSVTSNEISFSSGVQGVTAGCTAPPNSPGSVNAHVQGGVATVSWQPVADASSYLIAAGSAPGLSDVYYGDVGNSPVVSAAVGAGFRAYVRVIAVNACGQSAASADVFLQ